MRLKTCYECAGNDDEQRKAPAPGDPDFRWHASIPERATLDYIKYVLSAALCWLCIAAVANMSCLSKSAAVLC